jgi:hypothetical protein
LRIILLILLINLSEFAIGQNLSSEISDKEITDFIEWELSTSENKKKVYYQIEEWTEKNFQQIKNIADRDFEYTLKYLFTKENQLDTIFSKMDIEYLIKQKNSIKKTDWGTDFKNHKISKRKKNRVKYSIPLFSKNKKYVVLYKELWRGMENARGCYYLYTRIKSGWKLVGNYNCWMS